MIDHISSYTTDFPAARAFYEAVMHSLGYAIQAEMVTDWDSDFPERRCCAWGPMGAGGIRQFKSVEWEYSGPTAAS